MAAPKRPAILFRLANAAVLAVVIYLGVLADLTVTAAIFDKGGLPGEDALRTGIATVGACEREDTNAVFFRYTSYRCTASVRWRLKSMTSQIPETETVWSRSDLSGRQVDVREGKGSVCVGCDKTTVVPVDHPKAGAEVRGPAQLWGVTTMLLCMIIGAIALFWLINGPGKPRKDGRSKVLVNTAAAAVVFVGYIGLGGIARTIGGMDFQLGTSPSNEVRATGTATVDQCRRQVTGLLVTEFVEYECPAEATWQGGTLPPGKTTVQSQRDISGQRVEVRSAKESCGRQCVAWWTVPADHPNPSGAARWWLGFGQAAAVALWLVLVLGGLYTIVRPRRRPTEGTALPDAPSEQQRAQHDA